MLASVVVCTLCFCFCCCCCCAVSYFNSRCVCLYAVLHVR